MATSDREVSPEAALPPPVSAGDALRVWARIGLQSFGGPAGQIAVMHRIVVTEKRWISEQRFLHALNYCMLLPGPEAQQLVTYLGWLLHGYRGGVIAGSLFVLPGFLSILALSILYTQFQGVGWITALFFGLKSAVLAVVLEAVLRIGRRILKSRALIAIAVLAFVGMFFFEAPFPLVVLGAGVTGWLGHRLRPDGFLAAPAVHATTKDLGAADVLATQGAAHTRPSLRRAARLAVVLLALWWGPIALLAATLGPDHVFTQVGLFFSKAAVVTFGGAYAVLAYLAQQAVEHYGWLTSGAMLDGLGLAETTPGPLIMVTQFVGFLGAFHEPGSLAPLVAGTLAALLTTWVTFVPCFLWIFLGAPYVELLRGLRPLAAALSGITAAVVGVILNLACWFGLHVVFGSLHTVRPLAGMRLLVPEWSTLDPLALVIFIGAAVALIRFRRGMFPVLALGVALGILGRLLFPAGLDP